MFAFGLQGPPPDAFTAPSAAGLTLSFLHLTLAEIFFGKYSLVSKPGVPSIHGYIATHLLYLLHQSLTWLFPTTTEALRAETILHDCPCLPHVSVQYLLK